MSRVLDEAGKYKLSLNKEEIQGMKKNDSIKIGDMRPMEILEKQKTDFRA